VALIEKLEPHTLQGAVFGIAATVRIRVYPSGRTLYPNTVKMNEACRARDRLYTTRTAEEGHQASPSADDRR